MKILVLHRIPYDKIKYHRGINHDIHDVTYVGTKTLLATLPEGLRCRKVEIPGTSSIVAETMNTPVAVKKFDRLVALSEYNLLEGALLRELMGIPGPRYADTLLVRDKMKMKSAVKAAGIRVPKFKSCRDLFQTRRDKFSNNWSGKTILKPIDGAASENVFKYSSMRAALTAVVDMESSGQHDMTKYQLEEFVEGDIWHVDGLVLNGKVTHALPSQYVGTCLDYAKGRPLASVQCDMTAALHNWTDKIIESVRIANGSFHLEFIQTKDGPCFLEIGARVGGADVVDTFEMASGIHLPSEELKIILGEADTENPPPPIKKTQPHKYGWFVYPGHLLRTDSYRLTNHHEFVTSPQMVRWNRPDPNQKFGDKITYQAAESPFAGIVRGSSTKELLIFIENLFSTVSLGNAEEAELLAV